MIELKKGDILKADVQVLVNTVNCVGIMGRGIALQFRKAFPDNYKNYEYICKKKELKPGQMLVFEQHGLYNPKYIINFPTKNHWKSKSKIEDIESGLKALVHEVVERKITSIAIPPLGCGLGGLDWKQVKPLIMKAFESLTDVKVSLFEPSGAPATKTMAKDESVPAMTPSRAALIGLMRNYLAAIMDPFITLLEVHKLLYFLQEAGEPLNLNYEKGYYGPYAENLRHVLNRLEGHYISGFGDGADQPDIQIELLDTAYEASVQYLKNSEDTLERFNRVAKLIEGFETSYGMELLATTHWVVRHEGAKNKKGVIKMIYKWSDHKKKFKKEHIEIAIQTLVRNQWLDTQISSH